MGSYLFLKKSFNFSKLLYVVAQHNRHIDSLDDKSQVVQAGRPEQVEF